MGKNFNIYVSTTNSDLFEAEENKSGLINGFLSTRYALGSLSEVAEIKNPIKTKEDAERLLATVSGKTYAVDGKNPVALTCKNGHPSEDGKHCHNAKCVYGR